MNGNEAPTWAPRLGEAHAAWQEEPANRKRVVELQAELRRVSHYTGVPCSVLLDRLAARNVRRMVAALWGES